MARHPDADIFPAATGLAKRIVDQHNNDEDLVLYSGWFCPFVQRVWAVLEEKKIPYKYIEVNPYDKPESLLKLNPRGLVPTLQYDNKPLYESTVVCEFIEDTFTDYNPKLRPDDPYQRAVSRIWTDFVTSRIVPSFHRFLQHQPGQSNSSLDELREEFHGHIKQFAEAMNEEGPSINLYVLMLIPQIDFFGSDPTLIDFIMAPWAVRFWVFDHFKGGLGLPTEGPTWARWREWLSAIETRKSISETMSDREKYLPLYQRYADNKAQSELAKATRMGRGVP